jgi:hypothetical protein
MNGSGRPSKKGKKFNASPRDPYAPLAEFLGPLA